MSLGTRNERAEFARRVKVSGLYTKYRYVFLRSTKDHPQRIAYMRTAPKSFNSKQLRGFISNARSWGFEADVYEEDGDSGTFKKLNNRVTHVDLVEAISACVPEEGKNGSMHFPASEIVYRKLFGEYESFLKWRKANKTTTSFNFYLDLPPSIKYGVDVQGGEIELATVVDDNELVREEDDNEGEAVPENSRSGDSEKSVADSHKKRPRVEDIALGDKDADGEARVKRRKVALPMGDKDAVEIIIIDYGDDTVDKPRKQRKDPKIEKVNPTSSFQIGISIPEYPTIASPTTTLTPITGESVPGSPQSEHVLNSSRVVHSQEAFLSGHDGPPRFSSLSGTSEIPGVPRTPTPVSTPPVPTPESTPFVIPRALASASTLHVYRPRAPTSANLPHVIPRAPISGNTPPMMPRASTPVNATNTPPVMPRVSAPSVTAVRSTVQEARLSSLSSLAHLMRILSSSSDVSIPDLMSATRLVARLSEEVTFILDHFIRGNNCTPRSMRHR